MTHCLKGSTLDQERYENIQLRCNIVKHSDDTVSKHKRLKLFGEAGTAAVKEELQQLYERGVIEPQKVSSLAFKQKAGTHLLFMKKMRTG